MSASFCAMSGDRLMRRRVARSGVTNRTDFCARAGMTSAEPKLDSSCAVTDAGAIGSSTDPPAITYSPARVPQ